MRGVDHDLRGVDQTSRWKSPGVVFLNANKDWNEIKKDPRMVVTNSFASEFIANWKRYFVQKLSYCSENIIKLKWRIPARSDLQRPWQNLESSKKVMVNQASKKFQFCCSRYLKKVLFSETFLPVKTGMVEEPDFKKQFLWGGFSLKEDSKMALKVKKVLHCDGISKRWA